MVEIVATTRKRHKLLSSVACFGCLWLAAMSVLTSLRLVSVFIYRWFFLSFFWLSQLLGMPIQFCLLPILSVSVGIAPHIHLFCFYLNQLPINWLVSFCCFVWLAVSTSGAMVLLASQLPCFEPPFHLICVTPVLFLLHSACALYGSGGS